METVEKGFLINVFSAKNSPGLLVSILEAFEDLGLDVLDANVSCSDSFRLEAVGGEVRTWISLIVLILLLFIFPSVVCLRSSSRIHFNYKSTS